jgi:hypothetical protein
MASLRCKAKAPNKDERPCQLSRVTVILVIAAVAIPNLFQGTYNNP